MPFTAHCFELTVYEAPKVIALTPVSVAIPNMYGIIRIFDTLGENLILLAGSSAGHMKGPGGTFSGCVPGTAGTERDSQRLGEESQERSVHA